MSEPVAMLLKISMLLVFFGVMIYIGLRCRRYAVDVNSFVLGGRAVGSWLTAFAFGGSYFSAVVFVGYSGQFGWKFGLSAVWIGIGNALIGSLFAWMVLARRTRLITQRLSTTTMPDYFGKRFSSNALRIGASLIVFIFLIPYSASLFNGLSRLFNMAFGIDYVWCIILMSALACIYVVAGGYMATAINDFIQGIVMIFGIVAVIVAILNTQGGLFAAIEGMSKVSDSAVAAGGFTSIFGPDPFSLLGVIILTSFGTWGLPQMVGKFYAIRDERAIKKGMIISTIFATIVAGGCYFLGSFGRLFDVDVNATGFDSIVPTMLENIGPALVGIIVVLVLASSMSTLSSLVLTSSSTLTLDFIKGNIVKDMKEKQQLLIMRVFIAIFVVLSATIAILQYKFSFAYIAQLMGVSWGSLAGAFLAPYLYSLYWKRTTKAAAWASFGFGVSIMVLNMLFRSSFPEFLQSPINCGAFAMLAGLVIVPIVSLMTKAPDRAFVDDAFAGYKKSAGNSK